MMRNTFLALVLANLGFAAWAAWFAAPGDPGPTVTDAAPARITLISELRPSAVVAVDASVPPREPPRPVATDANPAAGSCLSIGPFQELAQASAAQGILRDAGYAPNQRVIDGEIWVGYWVHIAGIPDREAASEILAELRENDISDAYIVPGSEESQIISLGVFSEINRAASVRERVRALGYEPTVADRSRGATLYWIDIVAPADRTIDLEALQSPGRINRLEQRRCSSVGR
jgi:hypothetical protein